MRQALLLTAAIATLCAGPALAQSDTSDAPSPKTCQQLIEDLGPTIILQSQSTVEDTGTGCRVTNLFVVPAAPSRFRVAELTIAAPNLFRDWAAKQLPTELDLRLSGVVLSPETGSELTTYMVEMQADPMEIHLAYRWNQDAGTIELADLSVVAPELGSFRFAGRLSNAQIEPQALEDLRRQGGTIDEVIVEIRNARFFSAYLAPMLVSSLPYDQDPRPLIEQYIATATAFIQGLPAANVSDDSKAALVAFVEGFPRIRGDYTINLSAEPGIDLANLAGGGSEALLAALNRVRIAATHSSTETP